MLENFHPGCYSPHCICGLKHNTFSKFCHFLLIISLGNKGKVLLLVRVTEAGGFTWHASFKIKLTNSLSSFMEASG